MRGERVGKGERLGEKLGGREVRGDNGKKRKGERAADIKEADMTAIAA